MEQKRLEQVSDSLKKWVVSQTTFSAGFEMSRVQLSKAVDALNAAADIQVFLEVRVC